jgi:hypothetical protein
VTPASLEAAFFTIDGALTPIAVTLPLYDKDEVVGGDPARASASRTR